MKREVVCLNFSVLFKYHFSALTGHHRLSSATDERVLISGKKMSPGKKVKARFLAIRDGSGTVLAPWPSNLMWFCLVVRAWR